ncbi:MAG: 2-isopropylmalate synthase [Candidatus Spyradocola sp.]|jgi:2-isopropylmalate synthase
MQNASKYGIQYFAPENPPMRWARRDHIERAPIWCSVDLRDGNQALIVPMSLEEKIEFFETLVRAGFREIEVGFPAASDTEYQFVRALIERNLIPDDVTIQVLTQSREHIVRRTYEALRGVKHAIVHLYNSTSLAQREQVFHKSRKEIIEIATSGAELCVRLRDEILPDACVRFEYSPESFTGTEMDFAAEICNEVLRIFQPTAERPAIINLPATVSLSMPHIYANQIEYMCDHLIHRENVIVSLHPHNDRGCAVADTEMGLLAGADRVEGTLFGNGERTGNTDIVTLALNMYAQGVDPGLDFSNLPALLSVYERVTGMHVYERQPYSGQLVFAAFSGGHQDAITKGMKWRAEHGGRWTVPYLAIDPEDIGRTYESDVIRINSQSGKGGIGHVLESHFGYDLPAAMREDFSYTVKRISDQEHREMQADDILAIFMENYVNNFDPLDVVEAHFKQENGIVATITVFNGSREEQVFTAQGNGRLDAVSNALKANLGYRYSIIKYQEHAIEQGSNAKAIAYVGIQTPDGRVSWGAGTHDDIMAASVNALVSAINRLGK